MEKEPMLEYYRFKEINDLFTAGRAEEARLRLTELQARYIGICDENAVLRIQMQGYEDILYLSRNLIFDGGFYWLVTSNIKQGPFCPHCYNRDGLLLRLIDDGVVRRCGVCATHFERNNAGVLPKVASLMGASGIGGTMGMAGQTSRRKARIIPFAR